MQQSKKEIWFITGSQHLYGEETLKQVAQNAKEIVGGLNNSNVIPVEIIYKPIVTDADMILRVCIEASASESCIGVITWMHTFSPAKMWIAGLIRLSKPMCHLHTQFNAEIPWENIDMDFMNLNQSAHGDREFGHLTSRLRKSRKVVVGHWKNKSVQHKIGAWSRVILGWDELQHLKLARIGDNMREVAVTEGDKVDAQIRFGFSVNGYDTSSVTQHIKSASESDVSNLIALYEEEYILDEKLMKNGVITDWREPNVIRLAPAPFYCSFEDMYEFGQILKELILNK